MSRYVDVAGPRVWNKLRISLRVLDDIVCFRKQLNWGCGAWWSLAFGSWLYCSVGP